MGCVSSSTDSDNAHKNTHTKEHHKQELAAPIERVRNGSLGNVNVTSRTSAPGDFVIPCDQDTNTNSTGSSGTAHHLQHHPHDHDNDLKNHRQTSVDLDPQSTIITIPDKFSVRVNYISGNSLSNLVVGQCDASMTIDSFRSRVLAAHRFTLSHHGNDTLLHHQHLNNSSHSQQNATVLLIFNTELMDDSRTLGDYGITAFSPATTSSSSPSSSSSSSSSPSSTAVTLLFGSLPRSRYH